MPTFQIKRHLLLVLFVIWLALFGIWLGVVAQSPALNTVPQMACPGNTTIPITVTNVSAPMTKLEVTEGGSAISYTMALCSPPSAPVSIYLHLDAAALPRLRFTQPLSQPFVFAPATYKTPQAVTLSAPDNSQVGPISVTGVISHNAVSADLHYTLGVTELPFIQVTILDNEGDDEQITYLPVIRGDKPPTPTPTSTPTPLPPAQWQQVANTAGRDVDVVVAYQDQLLAGDRTVDNTKKGIYRIESCSAAALYTPITQGPNVRDLALLGNRALAAINGDAVYFSAEPLANWQPTGSAMNEAAFAVAFASPTLAYAGTDDGVYSSVDQGQTWNRVAASGNPALVNTLRYDAASQTLWIGTYGAGVWTLSPSQQFTQLVDGLANPNTDRRVWDILVVGNQVFIATTNGVYYRAGESGPWQPFGAQLQGLQVLSLEVAAVDDQQFLFAGLVENGIWRTPLDSGAWVRQDFSAITVGDLLYDQANAFCGRLGETRNALIAATTNGVWIYR